MIPTIKLVYEQIDFNTFGNRVTEISGFPIQGEMDRFNLTNYLYMYIRPDGLYVLVVHYKSRDWIYVEGESYVYSSILLSETIASILKTYRDSLKKHNEKLSQVGQITTLQFGE